jgi:hypothetical protein
MLLQVGGDALLENRFLGAKTLLMDAISSIFRICMWICRGKLQYEVVKALHLL